MFLADEAALRAIYGFTGASGLKSCPLCRNVYAVGNKRGIQEGDGRVLHTCSDCRKIILWAANGLSEALTALEREFWVRGKGAFEDLETALGWKRHPGGVLEDLCCAGCHAPNKDVKFRLGPRHFREWGLSETLRALRAIPAKAGARFRPLAHALQTLDLAAAPRPEPRWSPGPHRQPAQGQL